MALKELQFYGKHFNHMFDECFDFFYCSMRKGTVMHYLEMWDWQWKIFKNKWTIRGCILLLKTIKRIRRDITAN